MRPAMAMRLGPICAPARRQRRDHDRSPRARADRHRSPAGVPGGIALRADRGCRGARTGDEPGRGRGTPLDTLPRARSQWTVRLGQEACRRESDRMARRSTRRVEPSAGPGLPRPARSPGTVRWRSSRRSLLPGHAIGLTRDGGPAIQRIDTIFPSCCLSALLSRPPAAGVVGDVGAGGRPCGEGRPGTRDPRPCNGPGADDRGRAPDCLGLRARVGARAPAGCYGAPDRIRTCDLRLRRPTLYPLSYRRAGRDHTR